MTVFSVASLIFPLSPLFFSFISNNEYRMGRGSELLKQSLKRVRDVCSANIPKWTFSRLEAIYFEKFNLRLVLYVFISITRLCNALSTSIVQYSVDFQKSKKRRASVSRRYINWIRSLVEMYAVCVGTRKLLTVINTLLLVIKTLRRNWTKLDKALFSDQNGSVYDTWTDSFQDTIMSTILIQFYKMHVCIVNKFETYLYIFFKMSFQFCEQWMKGNWEK